MHDASILFQVALAIVAATAFAFLAKRLRQPLILGYLAAGILLGPTEGLELLSPESVEPIAELGLVLLLFMIGLEIDLRKLRAAGKPVILAGLLQFPAGVLLGLLVMPLLGFAASDGAPFAPLYLAIAVSLSSTMIVVKLLYDKGELDTLAGRVTLGILVFQDIWAILFLSLQPDLRDPNPLVLVVAPLKGLLLIAFGLVVSRWVLPVLFRWVAKVPELLLMGALGWCFLMALIAEKLGLSLEMGALIAGISLSTYPYNVDVISKIISLRDFFITLFFVALGARIPRPTGELLLASLAVSLFLVASRFLTLTPLLRWLGVGNRVSLLAPLHLAQLSEFSLVICSIGLASGHVDAATLSVVVYTLVVTSVLSTYGITLNHQVVARLNPLLLRLGLRDRGTAEADAPEIPAREIVLVGFHRHASSLLHELLARDAGLAGRIGVIDFNPQVKDALDRLGIANVYGDISHADTLHHAAVEEATVIVCTIPDTILRGTTNARLLRQLRQLAPHARIIVTAERLNDARDLIRDGAAFVSMTRLMGAGELADVVIEALEGDLAERRRVLVERLDDREEVMP